MNKSRVLAGMVATVAVAAVIAGGTVFGVNIHNEQVARQLDQQHHAQAVATMLAIEGNTVHTSGAAVDQAATVAGDAEAVQIAAQQAAAAKAAADAAAAQLAAQQAAQAAAKKTLTVAAPKTATKTTTKANTRSATTTAPGPVKCPAGSISNGADGNGNDISCTYPVCQSIQIPDPAHPECDAPFKP